MDKIDREMFLLHSETEEYKERLDYALKTIQSALNKYKNPIVSFSGGKDSLVLLHMVLQLAPDMHVFHWDYGKYYVPRDMENEILSIAQETGACHIIVDTSVQYNIAKRKPANIFYKVFFGKSLPALKDNGYNLQFIGLREEESLKRHRKLNGSPWYDNKIIMECHPLHLFTVYDVWAYIVSNNIRYLSHYDRYSKILDITKIRFATFFDPEFDKLGCSNIDGVMMPEFKNI
jgi:3'-phosphoadenosine 5'-phosphosulfate sulfotransferase (PAPS reductase)/FAD synthetase